jgi:hypothetical protein
MNAAENEPDPAMQLFQLREQGIALLRGSFATDSLTRLKEAATRCFAVVEIGQSLPEHYKFNRFANSILLTALLDFGCGSKEDLLAPISKPNLQTLFSEALSLQGMGRDCTCNLGQSWLRKKFPPSHAPDSGHHPQDWHQDGALGIRFPLKPDQPPMQSIPMTDLLTCWIPLEPCGKGRPGLEFVRGPQPSLLHFSELNDATIRLRFPPEAFWTPEFAFGDGLVFLNSVLHRTHTRPKMQHSRLSVEYRLFPR